jgi:hypothetical protein
MQIQIRIWFHNTVFNSAHFSYINFECVPGIHPVVFHAAKGDRKSCGPEQTSHCTENPLYVFPEKELRGISPISDIPVSDRSILFGYSKIDRPVLETH